MERLVEKYTGKIVAQGLADRENILLGGLDADYYWNREHADIALLTKVFEGLNINSLLYCTPKEPYTSIIRYLVDSGLETRTDAIYPKDSETRTFLHDLPISKESGDSAIVHYLKRRKCVLLPDGKVVSFGTVSPEECFVTFSSVCFACYVKFMSDCLEQVRRGTLCKKAQNVMQKTLEQLVLPPQHAPAVLTGPLNDEKTICAAICEAGRHMVEHRLVDSHFGNVSALKNGVLYISQTGSSLEELESCIDPCPLDGSSSAGITASSELTAHIRIYEKTGADVVLHGHPRFCAILSLDCEIENCKNEGHCHTRCEKERFVGDVPIVPGEVGTGRFGLCNTVPNAMAGRRGVIVFGHGLFTAAKVDFQTALQNTFDIERMCMEEFLRRVR